MGVLVRGKYDEISACGLCEEMLLDFISENDDVEQRKWMADHLKECPSCMDSYRDARHMLDVLNREPGPKLPEGFGANLRMGIIREASRMQHERTAGFFHKLGAALGPDAWARRFKGFGEGSVKDRFNNFWRLGGWKVMAPAMVCLTLTIGVFATGMYDEWLAADDVLMYDYEVYESDEKDSVEEEFLRKKNLAKKASKEKNKTTPSLADEKENSLSGSTTKPSVSSTPKSTSNATAKATTNAATKNTTSSANKSSVVSKGPVKTATPTPKPTKTPTPEKVKKFESGNKNNAYSSRANNYSTAGQNWVTAINEQTLEERKRSIDEPIGRSAGGGNFDERFESYVYNLSSMNVAEESVEESEINPFDYKEGFMFRVDDPEAYLREYKNNPELNIEEYVIKGTNPKDINQDSRDDALVFKLTLDEWEEFLKYSTEYGVMEPELIEINGENQEEIIVILTGYGE